MRARVHLVRHGEVENPTAIVYGGLPGFRLSERGRAQARAAAARLEAVLTGPAFIVASPLERARETADILRERLALDNTRVAVDPRLIEAGTFREGLPRRFAPVSYARRLLDPAARRKIEPARVILRRMVAVVRAVADTDDTRDVILVSHQFPIWMATIGLEYSSALAAHVPCLFIRRPCTPASITTLSVSPPGLAITYWEPPPL